MRTVVAAALAAALTVSPAAASVQCWAELSAGKTISTTRINDDFTGPVTIAADGLQGGAGIGCDYQIDSLIVIGAMARYEALDLKGRMEGGSYGSDAMWTVALRGGIKVNPDMLAYGMAGYSGTDVSYPGLSFDPTGITYGAGLEFKLALDNLNAFVEWTHTTFDERTTFSTHIQPESDTVRVGIRWKFNALAGGK